MRRYGHEKRLQTCSSFTSRNINLALQWRAAGPPPVGRKARRAVSTARCAQVRGAGRLAAGGNARGVPQVSGFQGPASARPPGPARRGGGVPGGALRPAVPGHGRPRRGASPPPPYTPSDWFRPQNLPTATTSLPVPAKATPSSPNLLPRQRAGTRGGQSPRPVPEMRPPDTAAGTPQKPAALTRRCGCGGRRVAPAPPHKAVPALRPSCAALTGAIGTRPLLIEAGALSTGPRRTAGKVLRQGP